MQLPLKEKMGQGVDWTPRDHALPLTLPPALRQGFPWVYTPSPSAPPHFPTRGPCYRWTPVPLQTCRELAGPEMAIANRSMKAITTGIQTLDI